MSVLLLAPLAARQPARAESAAPAAPENPPVVRPISAEQTAALEKAGSTYASAVVTVDAYKEAEEDPIHRRGAGVIATNSGFVFTPAFLVDGVDFVIVTVGKDLRMPARILGKDSESQLAILKVSFATDQVTCPQLCAGEGEEANAPVVMVNLAPDGAKMLMGQVVAQRDRVGPLNNVLEVNVKGAPNPLGGILLNGKGELVGIALATMVNEKDRTAPAKVFVLPASQIRSAVDRMAAGEGEMETERVVSIA